MREDFGHEVYRDEQCAVWVQADGCFWTECAPNEAANAHCNRVLATLGLCTPVTLGPLPEEVRKRLAEKGISL